MLLLMEQHCGTALAQLRNTGDETEGILVLFIAQSFFEFCQSMFLQCTGI